MDENKELLEEMMRDADVAAEPGTLKTKDMIEGGDDMPPMMATKLQSAGWVYIYDTRTYEPSLCNRNMLPRHLQKKRDDGSLVFTTVKPKQAPARGSLKCMLHPDGPDREHYDTLGLPTCRKANLTSPFQVRRHMEKRHKQEWATIQSEIQAAEKAEERAFQRAMIEGLQNRDGYVPDKPVYVPDKPKVGRPKK